MTPPASRSVRCITIACALQLLLPRLARPEGAVSYKFQSWQEDAGRVRVDSHYGLVEQSLPADAKLKLSGVIDSITGATPTGQLPTTPGGPVPLTHLQDRRKAWQLEASKPFGPLNLSLGYANSRESDYVSNGWSLNTLTDFNKKNTTLLLGLAGTNDDVKVFFQQPWEHKRTMDAIAGVTQLLDPNTFVTFNFSYGHASGYLSDPYKLIEGHVNVAAPGDPPLLLLRTFGENRPRERDKWIGFASINHSFPDLNAALEGSYRLYHDDFGITSHTVTFEWFQKFGGDRFVLRPSIRAYEQSAADFYLLTLDGTTIAPTTPANPHGPFYSSDYRLSKMRTITYGLKAVYNVIPGRLVVDAGYDRYTMKGRDGMTSASAYVDANVFTAGGKWSW